MFDKKKEIQKADVLRQGLIAAMRVLSAIFALVIAAQIGAFPQSSPMRIAGVPEPPELTGEPKKVKISNETERQFGKAVLVDWNDKDKLKTSIEELGKLIEQNPDYSDAYFMRAMGALCFLNRKDYEGILKDINAAISTHSSSKHRSTYESLADHYSLMAKIKFDTGRSREAMDDLDSAIKEDLSSANKVFNIEGVEPETKSSPCTWSKTDLDSLVAKFPKDYRAYLYRGLYFSFFVTFGKEDYYQKAIQEFQNASATNPRSPLPHYLTGHLYTTSSMWTKAAWSSDKARDEADRKAAEAFSKTIELV